jgi:hypothetical protein
MLNRRLASIAIALAALASPAQAQVMQSVVDIPTRPGVTQRLLLLEPAAPKAAVLLFAGGHGGLHLLANGSMQWGEGNFLIRSRQLFADEGLLVAVIDTPSDRQRPPYLGGFRQRPEHAADIKAVIAWLRQRAKLPVWLVGTSAGTWSVGCVATELSGADAPDGIVLSATITDHDKFRPVTGMPLERIRLPVLLVHHESDECQRTRFADMPLLMEKLVNAPKKQLLAFKGGNNRGDPCEAMAYHGFNGLERDVVRQTAAWILTP